MTKLYLVRHAEAEGNLYRRIHGHYDSLVTVNGYRQIEALAARFAEIDVAAVYASDLFRTQATAQAICEPKGLPLQVRPALRELGMGEWEDRTWGEVYLNDLPRMQLFSQSSPDWQVEGGETFEMVRERITAELFQIAAAHEGQTVAVFSHGTAIRCACAKLMGIGIAESYALGHSDNTAVTLLEFENGEARVVFRDDNSHLSEEISTLAQQAWWRRKDGTSPDENLWYRPLDLSQMAYRGLYLASRQEAWMDLDRNLRYLEGQDYLQNAAAVARENSRYLLTANLKNSIVGILQLSPMLDVEEGAGHIAFCYMLPEHRKRGLGVQLLGEAISVYRSMGRTKLRLTCGEDNPTAMRFYLRHGFEKIATRTEPFATLHILEKYIGY